MLQVVSLAQYTIAYTRSWAADSSNTRVRLTGENGRLLREIALLREEIRIKDARLARINAHRPAERYPADRTNGDPPPLHRPATGRCSRPPKRFSSLPKRWLPG